MSDDESPLTIAMSQALSPEELQGLTEAQMKLFLNRVALLIDKHGEDNVTPEMIQGMYEIVTVYLLPNGLE